MSKTISLTGDTLTLADVARLARDPSAKVVADPAARARLAASRASVEKALAGGATIYGINTGFGKLANVHIAPDQLDQLQVNLLRSHAAGVGAPLPADAVRALMLLRANVLARPTSGVRPGLVDALVALFNSGLVPWVPEQGSVGASGDLAPLSHVALVLLGEGTLKTEAGAQVPAADRLSREGITPWRFGPKEGISFINGTQAQTALLALLVHDAEQLWRTAVGAAALSLETIRGCRTRTACAARPRCSGRAPMRSGSPARPWRWS